MSTEQQLREAATKALEAMEEVIEWRVTGIGRPPEQVLMFETDALRAALSQPSQPMPEAPEQPSGETLYLVMAGGDCFQSTIVPESQLDDTYLLMQWGSLKDITPQERTDALAHFHDDEEWTHEQATGLGTRIEFSVSFEDGWIKVIRLPKEVEMIVPCATPTAEPGGEAVLAALDALKDDAAVHIFPDDLEKCSRSECVVEVTSVRATSTATGEKTVPLFSRAQVAEALLSASPAAPEGANGDKATIAGLESAVGHLSRLVDEQRVLLVEVNDVCGRDAYGLEFEDGDSELIDKVRAHLAATQAPEATACQACGGEATRYVGEEATEHPGTYCNECGPKAAKPEQTSSHVVHGEIRGHAVKATFPAWPEQTSDEKRGMEVIGFVTQYHLDDLSNPLNPTVQMVVARESSGFCTIPIFSRSKQAAQVPLTEERLREAFNGGFCSVETYNDTVMNDIDEAWEKWKAAHGIKGPGA